MVNETIFMTTLASKHLGLFNEQALNIQSIPVITTANYLETVANAIEHGMRVSAFFGQQLNRK